MEYGRVAQSEEAESPLTRSLILSQAGEEEEEEEVEEVEVRGEIELFGLDENSTTAERWTVLATLSSIIVMSFLLNYGGTFICLLFAGHFPHAEGGKSVGKKFCLLTITTT